MTDDLFNSSQTRVAESSLDLSFKKETFKKLNTVETRSHIASLSSALTILGSLIKKKPGETGALEEGLLAYIDKLRFTVEALCLRDFIDSRTLSHDLKMCCAIHPTGSGFPIFIRDFNVLEADRATAAQKLSFLPPDIELVESTLFQLFRGQYPEDTILKKHQRDYYAALAKSEIPIAIRINAAVPAGNSKPDILFKKSVERLDDTCNIPCFYSIYFRVAELQSYSPEQWLGPLEEAIRSGMGTAMSLELPYLAEKIENVPCVKLDMVERYRIGPFMNRLTSNSDEVNALFSDENDFILFFQKMTVQRTGEESRQGIRENVTGWFQGDPTAGIFSPVLESPQIAILPYRLVQKAHNLNLKIFKQVQLYGFSNDGGLLD